MGFGLPGRTSRHGVAVAVLAGALAAGMVSAVPVRASTAPARTAAVSGTPRVAAGADHTCALLTAGTVKCWGENGFGELGNHTTTNSPNPKPVCAENQTACATHKLSGVIGIAGGATHTCALLTAGTVDCWGANPLGELGNHTTTSSSTPTPVCAVNQTACATHRLSGVTAITAGGDYTCALLTAGTVDCWGFNGFGEVGVPIVNRPNCLGGSPCITTPVVVTGHLSSVTAIAAGYEHTCALLAAGTVYCWGYNGDGQLGNHSTTPSRRPTPVQVRGVGNVNVLRNVTAITAGGAHTCALLAAGTVDCWGYNQWGQLGTTPHVCSGIQVPCSTTPLAVTGIGPSTITGITAGDNYTCALVATASATALAGGTVACWGENVHGQLGNHSTNNSSTPTAVCAVSQTICATHKLNHVTAISAGVDHTCVLLAAGTANCWGANDDAQLGIPISPPTCSDPQVACRITPVAVIGFHT